MHIKEAESIYQYPGIDIQIQPWDFVSSAQVNAKYSDIGSVMKDGLGGAIGAYNGNENNIDSDPFFLNISAGNYHLKGASPCRDAAIFGKKYGPANTYHKYCDIVTDEWTPAVNMGMILQLLLTDE